MVRGLAVSEPLVVPCSAAVTTILVGFQHYLVMLGTTVLIATIIVPLMGGGHVCEPD
jgi:xanthine/uracil permease